MMALKQKAQECKCSFKSVCTCEGSMDFMDCISDACESGACDCHAEQYNRACIDMAGACPSLNFECSQERAVCTTEVHFVDGKEVVLADSTQIFILMEKF